MAITLIVEDGSNVPDANSYASVATIRTYLSNRGVTLPADDDSVAAMIIQGMDYLATKACEYQGTRTYTDPPQSLDWPRTGVVLNGLAFPEDQIPQQLIAALGQLVKAVNSGIDLMPSTTAADYVTREKVGPIETEYADPTLVGMSPSLSAVDAFLAPLFGECASFKGFSTYRV